MSTAVPRSVLSRSPRVLGTLALLRLFDREIVRYLGETLALLQQPRRYDEVAAQRLEAALRRCRAIPFYADRFAAARLFDHDRLHRERLADVPPLTKAEIRAHFADLQHPQPAARVFENTSGGSTGEPVRFLQDGRYYARMVADTLLFGMLNGKRPGEREVKLWGSERDILEGSIGAKERLINRAFNRVLLNSFAMDVAVMRGYVQRINEFRPVQVWAYIDSILELARFAAHEQLPLHNPRVVVCTAGTMYPEMRSELQRQFPQSRIVNQYGSREVGQLACDALGIDGMFLMRHSNHVELIDADSGAVIEEPGRRGQVLVTTLNNSSMPLVRFAIGDIAEYAPLQPGAHRALAHVHGRDNAHFRNSAGRLVHGEYFTHLLYGHDWLQTFQVAQTAPNRVEVRYVSVPGRTVPPEALEGIRQGVRAVMGANTAVIFDARERMEQSGSGKYQFVRREFA